MKYILEYLLDTNDSMLNKGFRIEVERIPLLNCYELKHPQDGEIIHIPFKFEGEVYKVEKQTCNQ